MVGLTSTPLPESLASLNRDEQARDADIESDGVVMGEKVDSAGT